MKNTLFNKTIRAVAMTLVILAIFVIAKPTQVDAGFKLTRLIDPFCITCGDDNPQTVVNNITDSNNVINSNNSSTVVNNSPGASVGPVIAPVPVPNPPTVHAPVVAQIYPTYPTTSYYSQLSASCYPVISSGNVGDSTTWRATVNGGNGNNYITWSGNDGLSGYGMSVYKIYNSPGSKYASITVTSGGQTITQNCINNVTIYDNNNYYNNNNNYNYNNYNNYSPLYVSCYANSTNVSVGSVVSWQATATGGSGYYTYYWTGTDGMSGYGSYLSSTYNSAGYKTASVTVTSNGQSVTQMCSNTVNVNNQYYGYTQSYVPSYNYNYNQNYVYSPVTANGLQIACFPDKVSARVGSSVTWGVEVIGGNGNFTYAWTGSEGLSSNQSSVITTYGTTGQKSATVTVSSNGQTVTQACGSKVNIIGNTAVSRPVNNNNAGNQNPSVNNQNPNQQDNSLSAASLFSLKNVPWGWVAVLVILVLMFTVMYLIFNRNKI